ncbi:MAG: hypothetical protein IH987_15430 [Planctomycetes bacterium]|nr:hypothetical protein [Planctomycetota bacterium]
MPGKTMVHSMESERPSGERISLSPWERLSFFAAHSSASALLLVLGLRGLYRFGRLLGTVEWLINHKRRRRFARALRSCSCEGSTGRDKPSAARKYFMRSRCDKIFYLIFDRLSRTQALSLFTVTNQEWLDEAVSQGRGVYLALSHSGAHHIGAMFMPLLGYKAAGVRDRNEGGLRRFVQDRFDRRHPEFRQTRYLFADSYPRDIYRCLQDGYVLASAMDVARGRGNPRQIMELTMFGEKRPFLFGPLRVAMRCRATVIQGFVISEQDFHYRLELVEKLIDPEDSNGQEADIHAALTAYASNIETRIRSMPELLTRI